MNGMSKLTFYDDINLSEPDPLLIDSGGYWGLTPHLSQMTYQSAIIFTEDECKKIIKLGKRFQATESQLGDGRVNEKIRSSNQSWIPPNNITQWLYEKISNAVKSANSEFYQLDLVSLEHLQFTEYHSNKKGHYSKHIDMHHNANTPNLFRKLSFSVQLSHSHSYEGGDLITYFDGIENGAFAKRDLGSMSFFPSFALHEVTPTTKGVRYSLVGWASGPRLK